MGWISCPPNSTKECLNNPAGNYLHLALGKKEQKYPFEHKTLKVWSEGR